MYTVEMDIVNLLKHSVVRLRLQRVEATLKQTALGDAKLILCTIHYIANT